MHSSPTKYLAVALLAGSLVECSSLSNMAIVDVSIGPFEYTVGADHVMVPTQFIDSATNTIRQITCSSDASCPQLDHSTPAVHCVSTTCVPDPFVFELSTGVIDLNDNPNVQRFGSNVTVLQIREVDYQVTGQGLTNAVGPTELYWGPESAVDSTSAGVGHVGTIAAFQLTSSQMMDTQQVTLDSTGSSALSDYLLHNARRIRLFARPQVLVAPGGPVPTGNVRLSVEMLVHIVGTLVR